jgi:ABC-type multidrug transport system fused ATPase/permease subunit
MLSCDWVYVCCDLGLNLWHFSLSVQRQYRIIHVDFNRSCLFFLVGCGSSGIRGACFGVANQILVRRMREKLFSTLLNQDIAFFDVEAVGALTSRLGSDCQQVSRIIGNDLNIMFRNALQGIGAFVYLMTLSWELALSTFLICNMMWYFMRVYGRSVFLLLICPSVPQLISFPNSTTSV